VQLFKLTVVIPTYNPGLANLRQTVGGLKEQDLPVSDWECIVVDNASTNDSVDMIDLGWHPNFRVVREERQGLTFARLRGFRESKADLIVFVDDDNILAPDYLSAGVSLFRKHPTLGTAGGRSVGIFEKEPLYWMEDFFGLLAVRPVACPQTLTTDLSGGYPTVSPIGAGMFVSRGCFSHYATFIEAGKDIAQDRTGNNLSSGGDNEINIVALKAGYAVGYFPELSLQHLINKERLEINYLKQLSYSSSRSWVKLLRRHKISPWAPVSKFSLPFRRIKAFLSYQPWKSPSAAIKYAGACGMFKGLSE
jgi:glycosyltransferase involved in cell wall biosynthesis